MKIENGKDYFNKKDLTAYLSTVNSDGFDVWLHVDLEDETIIISKEEMQERMDNDLIEDVDAYSKRIYDMRVNAKLLIDDVVSDLIGEPVEIITYIGEKFSCRLEEYQKVSDTLRVSDLYFTLGSFDMVEYDAIVPIDGIISIKKMTPKTRKLWTELFKADSNEAKLNIMHQPQVATKQPKRKKEEKITPTVIKLPKQYSPDLVNATMNPREISEKLKIALSKDERPNCITVLMSGIAGTGKSLAAQYIADELGKPLLSVKLGDILGKYVGETEGGIQEVFKQATDEGAIIVVDEFDSISGDRDGSDRNYQVSMVNSLLQALDTFEGIAFMTTNSTKRIDSAVRRRILLDVKFKNLNSEQADEFASKFFKRRRIKGLEGGVYAPADFSKLRDSLIFVDDDKIDKKYLMDKLKEVAAIRNGNEDKEPLGFLLK